MALDTLIQSGSFTADGNAKNLTIRGDWDYIYVKNETVSYAAGNDEGAEFFFRRGMTDGRGTLYTKESTIGALVPSQIAADSGFFYLDSSITTPGAATALTGLSDANPPVVTSNGHGLSVGDIVRFSNLNNQPQIAGLDFTVTNVPGANTFQVGNISLSNSTASTSGNWRKIPFDPIYYPRRRFITWVENAAQPKIYMSVTHGLTVGQKVRFNFPGGATVWGNFAAMDGQQATIIAINQTRAGNEPNNGTTANNIQVDFDTSTFGAWNVFDTASSTGGDQGYPASGFVPFSPAQVIPLGEDVGQARSSGVDELDDATRNTAIIGVSLAAGTASPAGSNGDVIWWAAYRGFDVNDE